MSRTRKGRKGPGHEFWGSRSGLLFEDPGPWTKTLTHRRERRRAKDQLARAPEDAARHASF